MFKMSGERSAAGSQTSRSICVGSAADAPRTTALRLGNTKALLDNPKTQSYSRNPQEPSIFMKRSITVLLILATALLAQARFLKKWSYQELHDQADLVVIGEPILTQDTTERATLPNIAPAVHVVGLSTEFAIYLVVKGDKSLEKLTLHHYRFADPEDQSRDNRPCLASFNPKQHLRFLIFLRRETDGRYAPVSGQADPAAYSVVKLERGPEE